MKSNKKWLYGNCWEKYSIKYGEIWECGSSKIVVSDIMKKLPLSIKNIDLIYIDPPWNLGNLNCFYTKADRKDYFIDFNLFINRLFFLFKEINAISCFIEMGKQNKNICISKMKEIYKYVFVWKIKYYHKNDCFLIKGSKYNKKYNYTGMDDSKIPFNVIKNENCKNVLDLCMGRGITGIAALKQNKIFYGVEINKRRLAVFIDRANKMGITYAPQKN